MTRVRGYKTVPKWCQKCSKRGICTKLCEKVEQYISQDNVNWWETLSSYITSDQGALRIYDLKPAIEIQSILTKTESKIAYAFDDGLTRGQIAEKYHISRAYLRSIICKLRKKARLIQGI